MYRTMNGMMPNQMDPNFQQMMRLNNGMSGDLRQKALQNQQQNGVRGYVILIVLVVCVTRPSNTLVQV